jgi:Protein of unknown function (DUF2637)
VSGRPNRLIRWTTTGCIGLLALIAGTVSYLHMHTLVALYGQPGWVAALTPLSVDGMIVAASATLLADSRSGGRGGALAWTLLVTGSVASLAANVAVAEPSTTGRVIAAWPSFALIGSYELLMSQVGSAADGMKTKKRPPQSDRVAVPPIAEARNGWARERRHGAFSGSVRHNGKNLQVHAWQWARDGTAQQPCGGWLAAYGQGHRSPVWSARAVGSARQEGWPGR